MTSKASLFGNEETNSHMQASPRAVVTMRLQEGIFADFLALTKARQYLSTSLSGKYTFDGTGHSLSGRYQKISVIEYLSLISAVNFDLEMHT